MTGESENVSSTRMSCCTARSKHQTSNIKHHALSGHESLVYIFTEGANETGTKGKGKGKGKGALAELTECGF